MLPDVAYGAGRNTYVSGELVIAIFALVVSVVSFEWNRRAARSALHSAETADRHARMPVLSPYFDGRHRGVLFIRNVGNGPAINIMLADGKPILTEAVVDQADRGWSGVAGAVVAGPFHPVGVLAGPLDHPGVGPVAALRVEVLFLVMSAMTVARMRSRWSGGKGRRVSGPAADDPDSALEFDPVRVDGGFGGGLADQGADRVVGEQVAVDLLADHVRAPGPQHPPGPRRCVLSWAFPVSCSQR